MDTDAGQGYLKAMGGPEGNHTLAAELVGTQLAQWFGLSTFDFAIVNVTEFDEIPFVDKDGKPAGQAIPGPAFITRGEFGSTWSGDKQQLTKIMNPLDVARLVVFDTWVLNCDRHSWPREDGSARARAKRDNVFLSAEAPEGRFVLKAMDHTHCFSCGREWTARLATIDNVKDDRVFGLFPQFREFLADDRRSIRQATRELSAIDRDTVTRIVQGIPNEWAVTDKARIALINLILRRAAFVAETIESRIWPQRDLLPEAQAETEPEA